MNEGQRPLQLILARDGDALDAGLPGRRGGVLVFYNDAAGAVLGKRFEEAGRMSSDEWTTAFGPFDRDGRTLAIEELPLTIALRRNRPAFSRFTIRGLDGAEHEIHVSAIPIVSTAGTRGAMAIFWPVEGE